MNGHFPIFRTKLTPPRLKQTVLRRPSVMKKLHGICDFPLTLIHSGPGYGKSTALSSFLVNRSDYCWYSVSHHDDEIISFLHYLIEAVHSRYPRFGKDLIQRLAVLNRSDQLLALCAEIVNELSRLNEQIIIVIDDYHVTSTSQSIDEWMQAFIDHIPENVHLVLSTRVKPSWALLATLKLKGKLLEISESDLIFSQDEVDVLFSDFYEIQLKPHHIQMILTKTEGWVMAIQLIGQQLSAETELDKVLENKASSLEDLFHFLASEVLSKQSREVQNFLKQTCIFEEISVPVINSILEIHQAGWLIKYVADQNLFLYSLGEGQYRYHALFKDFLIRELRKTDKPLFITLNNKAGEYFKEKGQEDQAIFHFESIADFESAGAILISYGEKMIDHGLLEGLKEKLDILPETIKDHYEALWIYDGDIHRYRCHYEEALKSYQRAQKCALKSENTAVRMRALEGTALVFLDTIQPVKAEGYLQQAVALISSADSPDERHLRLYRLMAENLVNLGRAREAHQWLNQRSAKKTKGTHSENLEARLYLRTGRLQEAVKSLESQKRMEPSEDEEGHLQQSHRETELLLSLIYSMQGEALKAKSLAQDGIMRGVRFQAPFVEACGWIRMGDAVQLLSHYDLDQALSCYETALRMMDDIHVPRGKAEPLMGLCGVYTKKGNYEAAKHFGELALLETEKVNDSWLSALIRLCMSITAFQSADYVQCLQLLEQSEEAFETCGDQYGLTVSWLWRTLLAFEQKDWLSFDTYAVRFLNTMKTHYYEGLLQNPTLFGPTDLQIIPPVLSEILHRKLGGTYVPYLLKKLGISEKRIHPGYTLYVQTLGRFRVSLGSKVLHAKDWHRDKAKELFQLFITKRKDWCSKDEILSVLWPSQDEASASAGLKVAFQYIKQSS